MLVSKRLRVVVVTPWYPRDEAPLSGIFIRDQVEALTALGHDVRVVHLLLGPPRPTVDTDGARHGSSPALCLSVRGRFQALHQPLLATQTALAVWRWRRHGFRADVVHAHTDRAALSGWAAARITGAAFGTTEHSSDWIDGSHLPRRRVALARLILRSADFVLAVGSRLASELQWRLSLSTVDVLPNVVDTNMFKPRRRLPRDRPRLVSTGMLVPEKGFDDLLRAVQRVLESVDCDLLIVGEGELREDLEETARVLGVDHRVAFLGRLSRPEVARIVADCDVYVCCSRFETFGVAVAEALACGVPVVCTRCGGPEDFISDELSQLVDVGDAAGVAAGVTAALRAPVGDIAREHLAQSVAARFGPVAIALQLSNTYQAALYDN